MQQLESGAVVDVKNSKLVYPEQTKLPQQTVTFDGFVKVHLNHYLFVDAQFNYREKRSEQVDPNQILTATSNQLFNDTLQDSDVAQTQATDINANTSLNNDQSPSENNLVSINYLKNYSFKQNRRFYSGELHYLDHPKFGVLIQIRKYRH